MRILITGGCGFIGHHFVEAILKNTDWEIIIIDKLNYSSDFDRLRDIEAFDNKRVKLFTIDFTKKISEGAAREIGQVDYIVHMGAESHVDNSIKDPETFVVANVIGTFHMLEFARTQKNLKWFVYFSTDEVFGAAPEGVNYKEWDRYNSGNPYSATKAGGEELTLGWGNSYFKAGSETEKLPVFVTHTMNVIGERQHPEKFVPSTIKKILKGEEVIIHANADKSKAGSRYYIHARNVADALLFLLDNAEQREKYNIVGEAEIDNLSLAQFIAKTLDKPLKYKLVDFHSSRPGHDLRYALDGSKLASMGWQLPKTFTESLQKTIEWSVSRKEDWL